MGTSLIRGHIKGIRFGNQSGKVYIENNVKLKTKNIICNSYQEELVLTILTFFEHTDQVVNINKRMYAII